jgi:hypothetical protein
MSEILAATNWGEPLSLVSGVEGRKVDGSVNGRPFIPSQTAKIADLTQLKMPILAVVQGHLRALDAGKNW